MNPVLRLACLGCKSKPFSSTGKFFPALAILAFAGLLWPLPALTEEIPSKALISNVPFVSWREGVRLGRLETGLEAAVSNPSYFAAEEMVMKYWGRDRGFTKSSEFSAWGKVEVGEVGGPNSLDDLKRWVARGVPVYVVPALTAVADNPSPMTAVWAPMLAAMGKPFRRHGPSTRLTVDEFRTQLRLAAERAGGGSSGVLGKMEPLQVFEQLEASTGASPWEASRAAARVIIGYDDERKIMVLHDPSFGPAWEVGYEDFQVMWDATKRHYIAPHPHNYVEFVAKRSPASPYPPRSADQQAAAAYILGYALASVGKLNEAEQEFTKGMAIPDISKGYRHLFLFELAQVYRARGNLADAITAAKGATELLPEHHRPWQLLAQLYRDSHPDGWQEMNDNAQKQAGLACSDKRRAMLIIQRSLARDFNVYGCEALKLLRTDE